MLSKDFLNKQIPVLKLSDTGNYALSLMEDFKLKHLPIVNEKKYVFLLSEKDIFLMIDAESSIENISIYAPYAGEETPILEVLQIISQNKLSILPIIDSSGIYLGAITLDILVEKMAEISSSSSRGAFIALEMNPQDYSLSHIVHMAESNNAKIRSFFSYHVEMTDKLVILLKIDLEDASPFLRSLERFNYRVLYYAQKQGLMDDVLKKRLDELMYYLEM